MLYLVGTYFNFDVDVTLTEKDKDIVEPVTHDEVEQIGFTRRNTKFTTFISLIPENYLNFIAQRPSIPTPDRLANSQSMMWG